MMIVTAADLFLVCFRSLLLGAKVGGSVAGIIGAENVGITSRSR